MSRGPPWILRDVERCFNSAISLMLIFLHPLGISSRLLTASFNKFLCLWHSPDESLRLVENLEIKCYRSIGSFQRVSFAIWLQSNFMEWSFKGHWAFLSYEEEGGNKTITFPSCFSNKASSKKKKNPTHTFWMKTHKRCWNTLSTGRFYIRLFQLFENDDKNTNCTVLSAENWKVWIQASVVFRWSVIMVRTKGDERKTHTQTHRQTKCMVRLPFPTRRLSSGISERMFRGKSGSWNLFQIPISRRKIGRNPK